MPQQAATIFNLEEGFGIIKEMYGQGYEFGEDYRIYGRQALKAVTGPVGAFGMAVRLCFII
jgi:hypothetical protein